MTSTHRPMASRCVGGVCLGLLLSACSGKESTNPSGPPNNTLSISVTGLPALDPGREGRWEVGLVDRAGNRVSLGTVDFASGAVSRPLPPGDHVTVEVTWEPPGGANAGPPPHRILTGRLANGTAVLSVTGALTQGSLLLREQPGQFTMFSPSNNDTHGYPSVEESGIWLFNMAPRATPQGDMWVRLSQLNAGWVYEGWMVRDLGSPAAIWLSYGKFVPDVAGVVNTRDDTGWGPFSGALDFLTAGEEEFPGDDWIENPLGFFWNPALPLPLNLREKTAQGAFRWTHVITIEPAVDRGEPIGSERPFVVRPYRDPFGDGGPGIARTITFRSDGVPAGTAVLR